MPEPESYEIVSVDPLSRIEKRNEGLEKEIREIRTALRGTVGLSKLEAGADEFITQMLGLMEASQKMVREVATSNQQVANKIQEAIDKMDASNKTLSDKMTRVLDFFAGAAESIGGEEESGGVSEVLSESIVALHESLDSLVAQNRETHETLTSIEKHLKKQNIASAPKRPPMRPLPTPQRRAPAPQTVRGFPPLPSGAPSGLPPPPPPPK